MVIEVFFPCCSCAVAFLLILSQCCICKPWLCFCWFSWALVWESTLSPPPFSYSWIVTLALEEHVLRLSNLISRKKENKEDEQGSRVAKGDQGEVKGKMLLWRRRPEEDVHLELLYFISSRPLVEPLLSPPPLSLLIFPSSQK